MLKMERSTEWVKDFLPHIGPGGILVDFFQILRSPDDFPFFIFGAELPETISHKLAEGNKRLPACGANIKRERAMASALAEGIERYSFITWDTESIFWKIMISKYATQILSVEGNPVQYLFQCYLVITQLFGLKQVTAWRAEILLKVLVCMLSMNS
jgi:hypothetical protein